jgi:hypothetical protein
MLIKAITAPSVHAESAKALIEKIRALRDEVPHFTIEGLGDGRSDTGGSVPVRFLESASVAIQKSIRLEQAGGADATTLRDAYAYAIAYDPVVQELRALATFTAHSIRVQRNLAGLCALDMYNLAKRLARRNDGAELRPFVDDMRNKLGKARALKADAEPEPAPVPATPSTKV